MTGPRSCLHVFFTSELLSRRDSGFGLRDIQGSNLKHQNDFQMLITDPSMEFNNIFATPILFLSYGTPSPPRRLRMGPESLNLLLKMLFHEQGPGLVTHELKFDQQPVTLCRSLILNSALLFDGNHTVLCDARRQWHVCGNSRWSKAGFQNPP